jgi:hypothetical protein
LLLRLKSVKSLEIEPAILVRIAGAGKSNAISNTPPVAPVSKPTIHASMES